MSEINLKTILAENIAEIAIVTSTSMDVAIIIAIWLLAISEPITAKNATKIIDNVDLHTNTLVLFLICLMVNANGKKYIAPTMELATKPAAIAPYSPGITEYALSETNRM